MIEYKKFNENNPPLSEKEVRLQSYGCKRRNTGDQPNETTSLLNYPESPASSASVLGLAVLKGTQATIALSELAFFPAPAPKHTVNYHSSNQKTRDDRPGKGSGYTSLA